MLLFIIVNLGSSGTFFIILHVVDRSVAMGLSLVRIEVATAGQKGLNINDPTARLQLRLLPNPKPVTAPQAACLLFVGGQAPHAGGGGRV